MTYECLLAVPVGKKIGLLTQFTDREQSSFKPLWKRFREVFADKLSRLGLSSIRSFSAHGYD